MFKLMGKEISAILGAPTILIWTYAAQSASDLLSEVSGSRNFVRGGPGQSDKKEALITFFFLVLSLFNRSQMVNFKEIYHFSWFQRGSSIFQGGGGVQLFPGGGSNYLFPIETHKNCDFPGGVQTPCPPPLDPHLADQDPQRF